MPTIQGICTRCNRTNWLRQFGNDLLCSSCYLIVTRDQIRDPYLLAKYKEAENFSREQITSIQTTLENLPSPKFDFLNETQRFS